MHLDLKYATLQRPRPWIREAWHFHFFLLLQKSSPGCVQFISILPWQAGWLWKTFLLVAENQGVVSAICGFLGLSRLTKQKRVQWESRDTVQVHRAAAWMAICVTPRIWGSLFAPPSRRSHSHITSR